MNIVVLDGYTLNPGDLDWKDMEHIGTLQVYERTPEEQIVQRAEDAEIVFTNKTPLSAATLADLPMLKYIGVLATGYDAIDLEAARGNNITVTNVPGYGAYSVAQMVFAHILNITNNVADHAADVAEGGWNRVDDYCYCLTPQIELRDKKLGIIGYGEIGKATAGIGRAFGMDISIHTRTPPQNLPEGMHCSTLDDLLQTSDYISLHCPLTEQTREIINEERIRQMKESAILINCSRGPLVNEEALARALNNSTIAAACLDVLSEEPVRSPNPLIGARNCVITPHIAWATREARSRLLAIAVDNLQAFLRGESRNCIT